MNPARRFFFHPEGRDRYWWAWLSAILCLCFIILTPLAFYKGHWINGCFNLVFLGWNAFMYWAHWTLWLEWQKKQ